MSWLHHATDIFLHLNANLDWAAKQLGPWSYVLLFTIIFCETGLVIAPFLPGDSMLFALGALCAAGSSLKLPVVIVVLCVAANCGDLLNYFVGYRLGPKVFSRESSWLLNKKHLLEAHAFYERHGRKTIVLARFLPFIRTFAPFVAGIGRMPFSRFIGFSVAGGIFWVVSVCMLGYFFGNIPFVKKNFEVVIIAIILITGLPTLFHALKSRNSPAVEPRSAV